MIKLMKNKGAGLVEYGILAGLISVVSIGSIVAIGESVKTTFNTSENTLASSVAEASSSVNGGGAETSQETAAALPTGATGASEVPLHFALTAGENEPGGTRGFGPTYGSLVATEDSIMTPTGVWWNPNNLMGGLYLSGDQRLAVNTGGTTFECDGFTPMPVSDSYYVNYNSDPDVDKTFIVWNNSGHIYEAGQDYNCALYRP